MTRSEILESARLPQGKGGVYRVRIIESNVQGSSGYYSAEMLSEFGPAAFPASTLSHVDHPSLSERDDRPERSVLTLGGYTISDPIVEADGLYADVKFAGRALEIVENFGAVIGLSIRAEGDIEEVERDGKTIREVKAIYPSPLNSIDLVTVPGAGGKIVSALQESLREVASKANAEADPGKESSSMEIEEAIAKAVQEAKNEFAALIAPLLESLKPAPKPEVDVVEAVKAAYETAADLPKELRDEVIEAVQADPNIDTAALVEKKKGLVESIRQGIEESAQDGRVISGAAHTSTYGAWK